MQCAFSKINQGASVSIQVTVVEYGSAKISCGSISSSIPWFLGHLTVIFVDDKTALPE